MERLAHAKLADAIEEENKQLNFAREKNEKERAAIERSTGARLNELRDMETALRAEVDRLHKEREAAMKPLQPLIEETRNKNIEVARRLEELDEYQASLYSREENLIQRAELIESKEDKLDEWEDTIRKRDEELRKQEQMYHAASLLLDQRSRDFATLVKQRDDEHQERQRLLANMENAVETKRLANLEKQKELEEYKLKLDDRAVAIQSGLAELQRKQHG